MTDETTPPGLNAHELAARLLALPDGPVYVLGDADGVDAEYAVTGIERRDDGDVLVSTS